MTTLEIVMAGCLAFGQPTGNYYEAISKHSGLQVIHADGAVTLRLTEVGREETAEDGAKILTISMKDERYSFEVMRHVRSWDDCGSVETWMERGLVVTLSGDYDSAVFELGRDIPRESLAERRFEH